MTVDTSILRGPLLDSQAVLPISGAGEYLVPWDLARHRFLELTGVLTGNRDVILPVIAASSGKAWYVRNATSGAGTVTVKGQVGGSGQTVAAGETAFLTWDETDFVAGITELPAGAGAFDYVAVTGTIFPVEAEGAVGDGVTDDQAAINAAIAAAVAAGGGVVTFNAGVYVVGAAVEIFDNVTLRGAGRDQTTIKLADGTNGAFDVVTNEEATLGNDGFGVQDLTVDGNHANNLSHVGSCIHFYHSRDFFVTGCRAMGGNSAGGGSKGYGIGVEGNLTQRFLVMGNTTTGNERHGIATTSSPKYGTISHNLVHDNGLEGIHTSTGDYLSLVGNTVYSNDSDGIGLTNAAHVTCVGNTCYANQNGISGVLGAKVIVGNYLRENTAAGIALEATSAVVARTVIQGNDLRANGEEGILITKPSRLVIAGNIVTEVPSAFDAIRLSTLPTGGEANRGIVITGNYLEGGSAGDALAIDTAGFIGMIITGNYFHNGVDFAAGVPTGSIIRGNLGLVTEARGTATVASGQTSVAVTHGLGLTPSLGDLVVTPTNNLGLAGSFWVADPTSTDFDIFTDIDPGASTATFAWSARII